MRSSWPRRSAPRSICCTATSSIPGAWFPYGPAFPASIYEGVREAAKDRIRKLHERVEAAGVASKMHLSSDVPSYAVEEAAKELDVDLIVMGTRGLTGLKHVVLGSVAERTVRFAPCPVLTVAGAVDDD